jgi:hypothetical protein
MRSFTTYVYKIVFCCDTQSHKSQHFPQNISQHNRFQDPTAVFQQQQHEQQRLHNPRGFTILEERFEEHQGTAVRRLIEATSLWRSYHFSSVRFGLINHSVRDQNTHTRRMGVCKSKPKDDEEEEEVVGLYDTRLIRWDVYGNLRYGECISLFPLLSVIHLSPTQRLYSHPR